MVRARLVALRDRHKLTQQQVAKRLGITRSFYGMIETGDRNPTLDLAKKISEMFGEEIEPIFFGEKCHELRQNDGAAAPNDGQGRLEEEAKLRTPG